jgi:hypothetical protein
MAESRRAAVRTGTTGRMRGWIWWLSMLWVVAGIVVTGYCFYVTTQPYTWADVDSSVGPQAIQIAVDLALVTSLVLPVPVLIAGFIRLGGLRRGFWLRAAGWAGAWIAGFALMYQSDVWGQYPAKCPVISVGPDYCPAIPGPAVVSWGELALSAAWLELGAVLTWILPTRQQDRSSPKVADKSKLAPVES